MSNEKTIQNHYYLLGVAAEKARCLLICQEYAADKNPPFKDFEDSYLNGWKDAANECCWSIERD